MNYISVYNSIIYNRKSNAISGYTESHHIIPRSLGGDNSKDNLVNLSAREHFIAHLLLAKIHGGSMWAAAAFMSRPSVKSAMGVKVSARVYSMIKENDSKWRSEHYSGANNPFYGKTFTFEQRNKMLGKRPNVTGEKHHLFGKKRDPIVGQMISSMHTYNPFKIDVDLSIMNRIHSAIGITETVNSVGARLLVKTDALRLLGQYYRGFGMRRDDADYNGANNPNYGNGQAIAGDKNPMYGKQHKQSTRDKIAEKAKRRIECPHCKKCGSISNMKRWHFDNCKAITK